MAGSILKGALISFTPSGGALGLPSLPNVIVFQINPETISHAWTEAVAPQPPADHPKILYDPLAVTGVPGETFSFTLKLDADEQKADVATDPASAALAYASGVYPCLAALEMLQFPIPMPAAGNLVGQVSAATAAAAKGTSASDSSSQQVPLAQVPVVLFVWGPGRITPVRVTAFSVTEQLFDVALNPTHAEATITLAVLTPDEMKAVQKGPMAAIAKAAYQYTQREREAQAASLGASGEGVLGMLPSLL